MKQPYLRAGRIAVIGTILAIGLAAISASDAPKSAATKPACSSGSEYHESTKKTIGIIGGVSWVSSLEYYRLMNQAMQDKLGGLNSARILMYSIDFGEFSKEERLASQGNWEPLNKTMIDAAQRLEKGGADCIVIASNTLNSTVPLIARHVKIPILHIADATGAKVKQKGIKTVALLGTKFTMEEPFYREILEKKYGLKVVVPNESERDYINTVIFDELCAGKILDKSREEYVRIIHRLVKEHGAEGVILGCTEIPLLVKQEHVSVPVFDTTAIHVEAAVDYSLSDSSRGWASDAELRFLP